MTSFRISDSIGECGTQRKMLLFMVMMYYNKRIQIKISKEKRYMGQNTEETRSKLPCIFSQRICMDMLNFPPNNVL